MGWKQHLQRLLIAGGSLALTDCQGCCNANPDPCCWAPEGQQCKDKETCEALDQRVTYVRGAYDMLQAMCVPLDAAVPDLADGVAQDLSVADADAASGDGPGHD